MKPAGFSKIIVIILIMHAAVCAGSPVYPAEKNAGTGAANSDMLTLTGTGDDIEQLADTNEEQKPVIPEKKNRYAWYNPSGTEYVALSISYGGFFPVADYGKTYKPGHVVDFTAGIYYLNFLGLSPEMHVRFITMDYREDRFSNQARLSQVQAYPAIVYRYPIRLQRNTLTVYGRIGDGLSTIFYQSRDPYIAGMTRNLTEYLNVFGVSAGFYYDVWKGLLVGVDLGYSVVSTARRPLQSLSLMLNVGWRIL